VGNDHQNPATIANRACSEGQPMLATNESIFEFRTNCDQLLEKNYIVYSADTGRVKVPSAALGWPINHCN